MARAQYLVVLHDNQWKISVNGQHYGPFATRSMAISTAVDAARTGGTRGQESQVLVQERDNQFRTEWTYGSDSYPLM